ncbi:putative ER lumen protein retaining receptor [Helianthus annuus]|nr:putative ER lumen protein retaining receptor [Helianthus annuus]
MGKKRGSHVDMLFFTLLRRQSMKIKVFLAMTAFISSLVALRSFVQNYNNFFVAAESVHAVGIIALIWKLTTRKTCSGTNHHIRIPFSVSRGQLNKLLDHKLL